MLTLPHTWNVLRWGCFFQYIALNPATGGTNQGSRHRGEREFFIDNLLVRIHCIIVMIRWTGLALWELEFLFAGSLTSTILDKEDLLPPAGPAGIVPMKLLQLQGYLAHKKTPPPRTLQQVSVSYERGNPVPLSLQSRLKTFGKPSRDHERLVTYRGASLIIRKHIPLGPYRRPMPRVQGGS